MFDIGFSEIVVIAVVALIVLGPERLPKAARTMGHLFGRLQRYVNDVKADINREMELEELKKLQQEVKTAAQDLQQSVSSAASSVESGVRDVEAQLNAGVRARRRPRRRRRRSPSRPRRPRRARSPRASRRCRASTGSSMADEGAQETFISHLVELRDRLLRAIIAVVVVLLALFPFAKDIYAILAKPLLAVLPAGATMIATDVTGTFLVPLKVTAMAAFVVALPYVLWQAWAFIAPGLYHHEKRLALPVIVSSVFFFLVGMAFAYFLVFPIAFGFFAGYAPAGVQMMTDIDKYLSFVLTMFIAFGVTFETPVVVIVLVRLRVVSIEKLKAARPYVIVGAFVIGADLHAARRDLAADARGPAVAPVRARDRARPHHRHRADARGSRQRRLTRL
jgi:sec-independent protein translocase protein TatC